MNIYVCNYLKSLGFNKKEINYINDNNEYIWGANVEICEMNISYFKEKGLNDKEIHEIIMKNPLLITENPRKFIELEVLYEMLNFSFEEIKAIAIFNSEIYNNPKELKQIIDYFISNNYRKEDVKQILLNSSNYLNKEKGKVRTLTIKRAEKLKDENN